MHLENILRDFSILIIQYSSEFIFTKYFDCYGKILNFEIWI